MSVLDTLNAATSARRSIKLCVDGALQAQYDALRDGLADAAEHDQKAGSLAFTATSEVVAEMDALREQIAASEVTFEFEHMDWTKRVALQAQHPPREDNIVDQWRGYNSDTFLPALVRESCTAVVGVDGDRVTEVPDATWERLLGTPEAKGTLNFQQVNELVATAKSANDEGTQVPPSARSWLESRDYGTSLAQPSPGTSPRSGSEAGSRPTSRKSTATKKAASRRS